MFISMDGISPFGLLSIKSPGITPGFYSPISELPNGRNMRSVGSFFFARNIILYNVESLLVGIRSIITSGVRKAFFFCKLFRAFKAAEALDRSLAELTAAFAQKRSLKDNRISLGVFHLAILLSRIVSLSQWMGDLNYLFLFIFSQKPLSPLHFARKRALRSASYRKSIGACPD